MRRIRRLAIAGVVIGLVLGACASPPEPPTLAPHTLSASQKEWGLAVSAVLTERNGGRHDILEEYPRTAEAVENTKRVLREWWGVRNRRSLLHTLHWLDDDGGHRRGFEERGMSVARLPAPEWETLLAGKQSDPEEQHKLAMARTYYEKLGQRSLLGWDYARYVALCRWGYLVGYLSEDEAWGLIMPVARTVQARFESWPDLGKNYLIGREFWSREEMRDNGHLYRDAYRHLVEGRESPWNRHAWYLKLD